MSSEASQPKVIVIAGANGAGKSTLAPLLLRDAFGLMEYVNADTIALGLSAFRPQGAAIEAGRVMLKRLHNLAGQRMTFAFESTLVGRAYAAWLTELKSSGYEFHLLFLWLRSAELAIERVAERVRMGGHDVAEDVARRRYQAGLRNFFRVYQPLATTWTMYDTSLLNAPQLVATGSSNTVVKIYEQETWAAIIKWASDVA